tara:strand:+ start:95 stop:331 length:237 start_codon:yes stop_codon:yes gene_type:complete
MGDAFDAASFGSLIYYFTIDQDQLDDDISSQKLKPILDRLGANFFESTNIKIMEAVLERLKDQTTLYKLTSMKDAHNA